MVQRHKDTVGMQVGNGSARLLTLAKPKPDESTEAADHTITETSVACMDLGLSEPHPINFLNMDALCLTRRVEWTSATETTCAPPIVFIYTDLGLSLSN